MKRFSIFFNELSRNILRICLFGNGMVRYLALKRNVAGIFSLS